MRGLKNLNNGNTHRKWVVLISIKFYSNLSHSSAVRNVLSFAEFLIFKFRERIEGGSCPGGGGGENAAKGGSMTDASLLAEKQVSEND